MLWGIIRGRHMLGEIISSKLVLGLTTVAMFAPLKSTRADVIDMASVTAES